LLALYLAAVSTGALTQEENIHRHRQVQTRTITYDFHSTRLHETMLQLNALITYAQNPALPLEHEKNDFLQQLVATTTAIAESAQALAQIDPTNEPGSAQVSKFKSLADQLRSEALNIEFNTRNMNIEAMNRSFDRLNQTCISCHRLFRGL